MQYKKSNNHAKIKIKMFKKGNVRKSKKPSNPVVVRPLSAHYTYHDEFRERLCRILSVPVKKALRERNLTIKQFCEDMQAGGYSYSYSGMRQAFIGKNISVKSLAYFSVLYAHLGLRLPDFREFNVVEE